MYEATFQGAVYTNRAKTLSQKVSIKFLYVEKKNLYMNGIEIKSFFFNLNPDFGIVVHIRCEKNAIIST
jgi:hypothetical protein